MHWLMNYAADFSFFPYRTYSACSNLGYVIWLECVCLYINLINTWLSNLHIFFLYFFFFPLDKVKNIYFELTCSFLKNLTLSCRRTFWFSLDIINQRTEIMYFVIKILWKPLMPSILISLYRRIANDLSLTEFLGKVCDCWILKGNE